MFPQEGREVNILIHFLRSKWSTPVLKLCFGVVGEDVEETVFKCPDWD